MKILIIRLSAIGDVIHSLPILHSLRRKFNDAQIDWVVEDRASDVLINNPLISNVIVIPKSKWRKKGVCLENVSEYINIIKQLRSQNYDIAIDLQELLKSSTLAFLSGAKRRIAHDKTREFAYIFANEKLPYHDNFDPAKKIIERYLEPAAHLGAPIDEVKFTLPPINKQDSDYIDDLLIGIDKSKPLTVITPATIWATKHWIEDYWSELIDMIDEKTNIIFCGVEKDNQLIDRIIQKTQRKNYLSLAGKTNLLQLIEIFNRTDILLSPDTGPAHIANATNKPVIIMPFGSTGFIRSGPYGEKHSSISMELPCQPCFKRKCPKEENSMECMKKLTPQIVYNIFIEKLTKYQKNVI